MLSRNTYLLTKISHLVLLFLAIISDEENKLQKRIYFEVSHVGPPLFASPVDYPL